MKNVLIGVFLGVGIVYGVYRYLQSEMNTDCFTAGESGAYEEQIEACNDFIDHATLAIGLDAARLYNNRGSAHAALGHLREALRDYHTAIDEDPTYIPAYVNRSTVYYRLGDFAAAEHDMSMAIGLQPGVSGLYFGRGQVRLAAEDYPDAVEDFTAALDLDPGFADALLMRAKAQQLDGNLAQAAADLEQVLARSEDEVRAHAQLGVVLLRQNQPERALTHFERAAELDPDNPVNQSNLGHAAIVLERYDIADAAFTAAIGLSPDNAGPFVQRAKLRIAAGRLDDARVDLETALTIRPDYAGALRALADLAEALDNPGLAIDALERLILIRPEDGQAHMALAKAHLAQGHWQTAIRHADLAEALDPGMSDGAGLLRAAARESLSDRDSY